MGFFRFRSAAKESKKPTAAECDWTDLDVHFGCVCVIVMAVLCVIIFISGRSRAIFNNICETAFQKVDVKQCGTLKCGPGDTSLYMAVLKVYIGAYCLSLTTVRRQPCVQPQSRTCLSG